MKKTWILLAAATGFLAAPAPSEATNRALITLGPIEQSLMLSYEFLGRQYDTEGRDTRLRENIFKEKYSAGTSYSLYDPHLLAGNVEIGMFFDQNNTSSARGGGSGQGFEYRIDGKILDKMAYPLSFFFTSNTATIHRQFSTSYDVTTTTGGFGLQVNNRVLPSQLDYSKSSIENLTRAANVQFDIETLNFRLRHEKGISRTHGNLSYSATNTRTTSRGTTQETELTRTGYLAENSLNWSEKGLRRELASQVSFTRQNGDYVHDYLSVNENLAWALGKALKSGLSYNFNHDLTQKKTDQTLGARLQHQLFSSLTTGINLRHQMIDSRFSNETRSEGSVSLNYQKMLPASSVLTAGASAGIGIVDREAPGMKAEDDLEEIFTAPEVGTPLAIYRQAIIRNSIRIINESTGLIYRPIDENNIEDSRFFLDTPGFGLLIYILTDEIQPGDRLHIIFDTSAVNPSMSYRTDMRSANIALSLFQRHLTLSTAYTENKQTLLSGDPLLTLLSSTKIFDSAVEISGGNAALTTRYTDREDSFMKSRHAYASLSKTFQGYGSVLSLYVRGEMGWITTTGIDTPAESYTEKVVSGGVKYSRPLGLRGRLSLSADYLQTDGIVDRSDLLAQGNLSFRFGRLVAELIPEAHWRKTATNSLLDERIRFRLIRSF